MELEVDRRYTIQKRQERYEPMFQGKWYKYGCGTVLLKDTLESNMTEADKIEQILGIIMDHKYSLKAVFKSFGGK